MSVMPRSPQYDSEISQSAAESPSVPLTIPFWSSVRGALVLAAIAGVAIFAINVIADLLILHNHELTARFTVEISDGISAFVIGLLSYQVIRLQQQRRDQIRQKLQVIADMNHHVRNALQVISLSTLGQSKEELSVIRESMNRIQWALRELLPKI
jgi:hypothetical protein